MQTIAFSAAARRLASRRVSNQDLVTELGYPIAADDILARTQIETRYFAAENETTTTLATDVLKQLAAADRGAPDVVIVSTYTANLACPGTAITACKDAGVQPSLAFDVSAACAGFMVGFDIGMNFLASGLKRIALVSSESASRHLSFERPHHSLGSVFSDGAAGVIVEQGNDYAIASVTRVAHPEGAGIMLRYNQTTPEDPTVGLGKFYYPSTNGVVEPWTETSIQAGRDALAKAGMKIGDIRWVLSHQARPNMLREVAKGLGASPEQVPITADRVGNLASASVPYTISELWDRKELSGNILLIGVGAGFVGVSMVLIDQRGARA